MNPRIFTTVANKNSGIIEKPNQNTGQKDEEFESIEGEFYPYWTPWISRDLPDGDGDFEKQICRGSTADCKGYQGNVCSGRFSMALAVQVRVFLVSFSFVVYILTPL